MAGWIVAHGLELIIKMQWTRTYTDDDHRCSFCRKPENEAGELIVSPSTPLRYICSCCVDICNGILEDRQQKGSSQTSFPEVRQFGGVAVEVWPVKYTPAPREPRKKP